MSDIPNKHLMIDIETLGTQPGCAVVSIGAVWFDPEDNGWKPRHRGYYAEVLLEDALKHGTASPGTLKWWMGQSEDARKFMANDEGKIPLKQALEGLDAFIHHQSQHAQRRDVYVWANGPEFDLTLLDAMYGKLELPSPWNYGRSQSCRTVLWAARTFFGCDKPPFKAGRTAHNALDDAIHQAEYVTQMVRKIRGVTDDQSDRPA